MDTKITNETAPDTVPDSEVESVVESFDYELSDYEEPEVLPPVQPLTPEEINNQKRKGSIAILVFALVTIIIFVSIETYLIYKLGEIKGGKVMQEATEKRLRAAGYGPELDACPVKQIVRQENGTLDDVNTDFSDANPVITYMPARCNQLTDTFGIAQFPLIGVD